MQTTYFLMALAIALLSLNAFATVQKFSAEYNLPTPAGSEIPDSARKFRVDYFVVQDVPDQETAIFVLPQELTGQRVSIGMQVTSIVKENGVVTRKLEGQLGNAHCVGAWKAIKCTYSLSEIAIDDKEVDQFLQQKFTDDTEKIVQLKSLSKEFGADPIGKISVVPSGLTISGSVK